MAKVRYTGERTGRKQITIPRFGLVKVGDVLEMDHDQAARFTALQPTRDYGTVEDVEKNWTRDELDVIARDHHVDPSEFKKKADLAAAIYKVDKTAAGQLSKADFESVSDSGEADVAPSEPPSPTDTKGTTDTAEGVTTDG